MSISKNVGMLTMDRMRLLCGDRGQLYGGQCFICPCLELGEGESLAAPLKVEMLALVVCTGGSVTLSCDNRSFSIAENTLFICKPGAVFCVKDRQPCRISFLFADLNFFEQLNIDKKKIAFLFDTPRDSLAVCMALADCESLIGLLSVAEKEVRNAPDAVYYHEVVENILLAFIYKIANILSHECCGAANPRFDSWRSDVHYKRFIKLLAQNYTRQRSVIWYASQMCINPKYLSSVVKDVSGKSAAQWIDEYVVIEAKNLLKYSDLSIQEIAYKLNFASQSFFGTYFKRQTGFSPNRYRLKR